MSSRTLAAVALTLAAPLVGLTAPSALAAPASQSTASSTAPSDAPSTVRAAEQTPAPAPQQQVAAAAKKARASRLGGFVPQVELPALPTGGVSPAKDELWLTGKNPAGPGTVLGHYVHGDWTVDSIPVPAGTPSWVTDARSWRPTLAASDAKNVWLATPASLSRWDGKAWKQIELPKLAEVTVGPIAVKDAHTTYVALTSSDIKAGPMGPGPGTHVFELNDGVWRDLQDTDPLQVLQLVPTAHGVSALRVSMGDWRVEDYASGTWGEPTIVGRLRGVQNAYAGLFVDPAGTHRLLGGVGVSGFTPTCLQWTKPVTQVTGGCTTSVFSGEVNAWGTLAPTAAQLKNGDIVIGGRDRLTEGGYTPTPQNNYKVEGTFALHRADGTEVTLAGDPGDHTQLMVAEPTGKAAWAVTVDTAGTIMLQRWDAKA